MCSKTALRSYGSFEFLALYLPLMTDSRGSAQIALIISEVTRGVFVLFTDPKISPCNRFLWEAFEEQCACCSFWILFSALCAAARLVPEAIQITRLFWLLRGWCFLLGFAHAARTSAMWVPTTAPSLLSVLTRALMQSQVNSQKFITKNLALRATRTLLCCSALTLYVCSRYYLVQKSCNFVCKNILSFYQISLIASVFQLH